MAYAPSPYWIADVLLKVNACVGAFEELQDDDESRRNQLLFGQLLAEIAGTSIGVDQPLAVERARCIVYTASRIRRGVAAQLRAARAPEEEDGAVQFPLAAYDLLSSAAHDVVCEWGEIKPSMREGKAAMIKDVPEALRHNCAELLLLSENTMSMLDSGLGKLRSMLTDASLVYADTEPTDESTRVMEIMCGRQTMTLVRNALNSRAIACLFDSVRVAAGVMSASHALGKNFASEIPDVRRAAIGRADAYAVQRLYRTLELLVAALMMGQAQRSDASGRRDEWSDTPTGQAVLRVRHEIAEVLKAYDDKKRKAATDAGRTYCAQTPGYVALLQEQAASIMLKAQEPENELHRALVDALSLPRLFRVGYGDKNARYSYWEAVEHVQTWREAVFSASNDRRVAPISNAIAMVSGSAALSSTDRCIDVPVSLTTSAYEAMRVASKEWPPMSNFYGKEYALTERKVQAKATKQDRDPREVGEALGYRTEWVGFLSKARDCKRQVDKGEHAGIRFSGSVTTLAQAEMLGRDMPGCTHASPLPAPYGASLHNLHGVALSMEPALLRAASEVGAPERSHLFEHADAHYHELMFALDSRVESGVDDDEYQRIVLERRTAVQERVEKISTAFKSWSGGAMATDLFHAFFLEVWRRFNANLCTSSSPWHATVQEWIGHYEAGTEPKRGGGTSKLMHPWRCMHLQRGVARALLNEWFGEPVIATIASNPEARCALRIQRCMLESVVALYDYAPWASHVIRRFCSIDERKYGGGKHATGKRGREE